MPEPDETTEPDEPKPDPDAGAKKALDAERKARREAEKALNELRSKLDDLEGKDKSELQKLTERNAQLERDLAAANVKSLRLEVAAEKGVKARWLSGDTREELEAAADEYLADHPPAPGTQSPPAKPAETLSGGGDPTENPVDIKSIVDAIPRGL